MGEIKVLRILNRFNLGGPTFNVVNLTKHLSEEFTTKLIGGQAEPNELDSLHIVKQAEIDYQVLPIIGREISIIKDIKAIQEIRAIIRQYEPKIVHTHASKAGLVGRVAAWLEGVPIIVHTYHGHVFHSYFGSLKTWVLTIIERFLARISTAIVTISTLQKEELTHTFKIIPKRKAHIIPLGFDFSKFSTVQNEKVEEYKQLCGIRQADFVFSIIGRLEPIKQHSLFLTAFSLLAKQDDSIKALIVGDGTLFHDLTKKAKELGLSIGNKGDSDIRKKQVVFTSWEPDASTVLASSHCVCLSSKNEGTPVSIIEALVCKTPVVSTNVGGVADIIRNHDNGILVNEQSPEPYSRAMQEIKDKFSVYSKQADYWSKQTHNTFHYSTLCKNMEELYHSLLNKHSNAKV